MSTNLSTFNVKCTYLYFQHVIDCFARLDIKLSKAYRLKYYNIPQTYRSSITPRVPNSSHVTYRVPDPLPHPKANCEPCDYV